jgi:glycosyltransferase involved in cell wall biosynthesis
MMVWLHATDSVDPPAIPPPPSSPHAPRPRFSVMVPTFAPDGRLLRLALESVLAQALPPEQMQITVVDDSTRSGATAALVREIDPTGRIGVVENDRRLGIAGNWNRAIELAHGELVHLLHQDDHVLPGFYSRIDHGFRRAPHAGMAFCRTLLVDDDGRPIRSNSRLRWFPGLLGNWLPVIATRQRVQTPSVVVRREVYETLGGYRPELCQALDWEMWVRIAARHDVWYDPRTLAVYRRHRRNESSRLLDRHFVWPDLARAIRINARILPETLRDELVGASAAWFAMSALRTAKRHLAQASVDDAATTLESMAGLVDLAAETNHGRQVHRRFAALRRRITALEAPCWTVAARRAA